MPRIRTLKPECRTHRKVGRLSDRAFRLWVGMILEADDAGRLVADAGELRLLVFGYHPKVTDADIDKSLEVLARPRLIRLYTVESIRYADFPDWLDHQRIDRPTPSRLPSYESSLSDRRVLDESSTSPRAPSEDRKGSEGIGSLSPPSEAHPLGQSAAGVPERPEDLLDRWNAHADQSRTNGGKGLHRADDLTGERRKKAALRLKEAELSWHDEAIARLARSPFACGAGPPRREGDKPWRASFDWYIANENNCVKAHEGRYDA